MVTFWRNDDGDNNADDDDGDDENVDRPAHVHGKWKTELIERIMCICYEVREYNV